MPHAARNSADTTNTLRRVDELSKALAAQMRATHSLKRLVRLSDTVREAKPVLKHFENMLASSLSCDSRSHDADRKPRQLINAILDALAAVDEPNDQGD